ncbi:MAG: hypothetical protein ACRD0E_09410, partial [Acidimicrobiales bacterium]
EVWLVKRRGRNVFSILIVVSLKPDLDLDIEFVFARHRVRTGLPSRRARPTHFLGSSTISASTTSSSLGAVPG